METTPERPVWRASQLRDLADLAELHGHEYVVVEYDRAHFLPITNISKSSN